MTAWGLGLQRGVGVRSKDPRVLQGSYRWKLLKVYIGLLYGFYKVYRPSIRLL